MPRGGEKQARGSKNCKRPVAKHTRHGYERCSVGDTGSKYVNLWVVTCVVVSHMVTRLIAVITLKCTEISLCCLTGTEAGPLYFKTNKQTDSLKDKFCASRRQGPGGERGSWMKAVKSQTSS